MMTNDSIVSRVRDVLNEHGGADGLSIGADRVMLDDYIERAIADAVVLLASKGYSVNETVLTTDDDKGEGRFELPTGFLSLVSAKLESWKREVKTLTEVGTPEYAWAMNEYTKPGVNTPVCYKDGDMLVCLPVSTLGAIKINVVYDGENLNAEEREANAVVYMAAALVMGFFEDDNGKQRLSNIATEFLQ